MKPNEARFFFRANHVEHSMAKSPSEAAVVTLEKAAFQYKGGPSLDDRPVVEELNHGTEHSNTA